MTKNSFGWNSLVYGLLNAPSLVAEVVDKNWFSRKKIQAQIDLAASFDISDLEKFQTDFFQTYIKSRHLLQ